MLAVSYIGLALCPALAITLLPRRRRLGLALLAAMTISLAITLLIQFLVLRPRPADARLLWPSPNFPSFPSGHAAIVFATATVLSLAIRRRALTVVALSAASLISISRIYLGVHYPSDVFAGAVLGASIGAATFGLIVSPSTGPQRLRWLLWPQLAVIIIVSLVAYLGLLPLAVLQHNGVGKILHAFLFGAVAFWLNLWLAPRSRAFRGLPIAILLPFTLAAAEEVFQSLSPLRSADVADLAADLAGMVVFWGLSLRVVSVTEAQL